MTEQKTKLNISIFIVLWLLCIFSFWAVLPYLYYLKTLPETLSFGKLFLLMTIQVLIVFGIVCFLSYWILPKTDLSPFQTEKVSKRIIYPGILSGLCVGFTLYGLDATIFQNAHASSELAPPAWAGLLGSFYGAINEEVLLRLFLFTLIYFLFGKIVRFQKKKRYGFLWVTNVIVALIFGLGHLPAAFKTFGASSLEIFRILFLNGVAGIVFGWLYWSRGLWTAMLAHFIADLVLHVF